MRLDYRCLIAMINYVPDYEEYDNDTLLYELEDLLGSNAENI